MCRHEYKVEYLCKFENSCSIGISKRGSFITQFYRYLLAKSRDLCTRKMKGRISTNEECDFCGCTFAISFIRESYFQKHLLEAIRTGFNEWYSITSQVNSYRGIHASNLHKTLRVILKEIGSYNFDDPSISSLALYFSRCSTIELTHFSGFSMNVKRKPIDVSFSGVMHSIVGSMKSNHGRGNKGTSENFYGNALKKNQPVSIDMDDLEDPTLPLGENTLCDYYSDMDMESDVDNAMRAYRRQSMASRTPPFHRFTPDSMESESASEDQETHIIECKTVASSNLGSQFGLEDIENYHELYSSTTSSENVLKFELLNPSLYLWKPIYEYTIDHCPKQYLIHVEKEDWYSLLVHNGSVYIAFVNFYHQYINCIGKGDIVWSKIPGYSDISITIPLMMMECRFQNRSINEPYSYQDFQATDISKVYPSTCFRLMNVSKDTHPILKSIRILPKFNPHISYACLTAVYNSTNFLLPTDVSAYLSRCKEIVRASYQAKLSYYQNARDRCNDDILVSGVIEAHESSVNQSPRTPRELSPVPRQSSPFSKRHTIFSIFKSNKMTSSRSEGDLQAMNKPSSHLVTSSSLHQARDSSVSPTSRQTRESPHLLHFHSSRETAQINRDYSPTFSVGKNRRPSQCSLKFQEQIETSLFNLSRVITLAALQFQTIVQSEHSDTLLYVLSTIYEFQSIVTEGDYHIFINTLLFNNSKYYLRYNIEVSKLEANRHFYLQLPLLPNVLSRLFCHWSFNVREYVHRLLVFKIIDTNKQKYSNLERILISAFETTIRQLGYYSMVRQEYSIYEETNCGSIDYTEVGRKMELLFLRNNVISDLQLVKNDLRMHNYTTYATRLAMELDYHLFSLFLRQYDDEYNFMYNEPFYSYMLHSLGRFSELLYKLYIDPENTKAPEVLNMVFSQLCNGA